MPKISRFYFFVLQLALHPMRITTERTREPVTPLPQGLWGLLGHQGLCQALTYPTETKTRPEIAQTSLPKP